MNLNGLVLHRTACFGLHNAYYAFLCISSNAFGRKSLLTAFPLVESAQENTSHSYQTGAVDSSSARRKRVCNWHDRHLRCEVKAASSQTVLHADYERCPLPGRRRHSPLPDARQDTLCITLHIPAPTNHNDCESGPAMDLFSMRQSGERLSRRIQRSRHFTMCGADLPSEQL